MQLFTPDYKISRRFDGTLDTVLAMPFRFIALDVETANGDSSSICQIGLACVAQDGDIINLGFLIDPEMGFERFNSQLHGIDAAKVHGEPNFATVIDRLRPLLEAAPLIQHSGFDKRAMNAACERYGRAPLASTWYDSVAIARRAWPQLKGNGGHGLASLKEFLTLEFEHHDAVEDARAAAIVVLQAEQATGHPFTLLTGQPKPARRTRSKPVAQEGNPDGPLYGMVVCFSGKLSVSRSKAAALAAQVGITVTAGLSETATFLVVPDPGLDVLAAERKSSKLRLAEQMIARGHPMRVCTEAEFFALLQG